uniref:GRR1-like protein 1 n=1 Tax=Erigeron canadensis TaxID=72917 RepID=UPI001CB9A62E|nr:GRR1-like protein 1 [Erigeron canadensis]
MAEEKKPKIPPPMLPLITNASLSNRLLNTLSLLNKEWFLCDCNNRREVLVSNVWAIDPNRVIERFPHVNSIMLVNPIKKQRDDDPLASFGPWNNVLKEHQILERLFLHGFSIKDRHLKKFSTDYPNLKELTLRSCSGFSFTGLEAVAAGCRNLTHLIARSCTFLDSNSKSEFLASLHKENMVSIEVSGKNVGNNCTGDPENLLKLIKSATGLEHLGGVVNVEGKNLSTGTCDQVSHQLIKSRKLESLSLASAENSSLPVPGFYIDTFLPVAAQIISLNLRGLVVDRKDLVRMITSCMNIRILQASSDDLDDFAVEYIGKHCKSLSKVKFVDSEGKSNITDEGLKHIANGYPSLQSLSICVVEGAVTCKSLVDFAELKRNIECLKLYAEDADFIIGMKYDVLDEGFAELLKLCPKLKKLRAPNVSADPFTLITGENLESLNVKVAAVGKTPDLSTLARSFPRLEKLVVENCRFISLPKNVLKKRELKSVWLKSTEGCIEVGKCWKEWHEVKVQVLETLLKKASSVYMYKKCAPGDK